MANDTISILDGSTFLVSDLRGDVELAFRGTPLLLLRVLLGLEPEGEQLVVDPIPRASSGSH
jgi:hypothetical protein